MSRLTDLRQAARQNLTQETLEAYRLQVVKEWKEARTEGWYHIKTMRESDMVEITYLQERLKGENQLNFL